MHDTKTTVLEGADIKSTAFYSRTRALNKHGQYANKDAHIGSDSSIANKLSNLEKNDTEIDMKNAAKCNLYDLASFQEFIRNLGCMTADGGVPLRDVAQYLWRHESEFSSVPSFDSHYEPLQPDHYIRFRLQKALSFYQDRIPLCNRARKTGQLLLVLGSITSAALAIASLQSWAAVVTIITSSITAYLEFQGTSSKIERYSFTVHALQELMFWWQTLPQIDRSALTNVDRLVLTCEDLLQREQQAWRSTSQSIKMLQAASANLSAAKDVQ